jgi:hypothetical protein
VRIANKRSDVYERVADLADDEVVNAQRAVALAAEKRSRAYHEADQAAFEADNIRVAALAEAANYGIKLAV